MIWLLANLKLLAIGGAILATFGSGYWVSSQIAEGRLEKALAAQEEALHAQCDTDKKLTEENSRAYQIKVSDLTRKLSDAKRLLPSRCVVPTPRPSSGINGATTTGELSGQDGVTSDTLLTFAADCEKTRLQVISMQEFENEVWKTH